MRKSFLQTLTKFAEEDDRIIFIVGDVGFSFIEEYKRRFPNQYLNAGIGEQNMMGMAVGMAHMGWKPYVYTMKNFILLRPHEQVRNDIGYGNANVKLFGVAGSAAYKFLGMSHNLYGTEEKDLLKNIPNMNTYFPTEDEELIRSMKDEYKREGPAYFAI